MKEPYLGKIISMLTSDASYQSWTHLRQRKNCPSDQDLLEFYMFQYSEGQIEADQDTKDGARFRFLTSQSQILYDLAEKMILNKFVIDTTDLEAYYAILKGIGYAKKGDFTTALIQFQAGIMFDERNALSYYFAGLACKNLNMPEKAIEYFDKTIAYSTEFIKPSPKLNQDSVARPLRRGTFFAPQLEEPKATTLADKIRPRPIKRYKSIVADIFLYKGAIFYQKNDLENAVAHLKIAKHFTPRDNPYQRALILKMRGVIYRKIGHLLEAEWDFKRAIDQLNHRLTKDKSELPEVSRLLEETQRERSRYLLPAKETKSDLASHFDPKKIPLEQKVAGKTDTILGSGARLALKRSRKDILLPPADERPLKKSRSSLPDPLPLSLESPPSLPSLEVDFDTFDPFPDEMQAQKIPSY